MAKGIFIALEGGEATGKTTTAKVIKERLEALGYEVVVTREPGGIPSAEAIRENIMMQERSCYFIFLQEENI